MRTYSGKSSGNLEQIVVLLKTTKMSNENPKIIDLLLIIYNTFDKNKNKKPSTFDILKQINTWIQAQKNKNSLNL